MAERNAITKRTCRNCGKDLFCTAKQIQAADAMCQKMKGMHPPEATEHYAMELPA